MPTDTWFTRLQRWLGGAQVATVTTQPQAPAAPRALAVRGVDLALSSQAGAFLRDAGLEEVTQREVRLPVGSYGGKIGHLAAFDLLNAYRNIGTVLVGAGVMTSATLDAALKQADDDLHSDRYRCVWPVYAAYGRRTGQ